MTAPLSATRFVIVRQNGDALLSFSKTVASPELERRLLLRDRAALTSSASSPYLIPESRLFVELPSAQAVEGIRGDAHVERVVGIQALKQIAVVLDRSGDELSDDRLYSTLWSLGEYENPQFGRPNEPKTTRYWLFYVPRGHSVLFPMPNSDMNNVEEEAEEDESSTVRFLYRKWVAPADAVHKFEKNEWIVHPQTVLFLRLLARHLQTNGDADLTSFVKRCESTRCKEEWMEFSPDVHVVPIASNTIAPFTTTNLVS